jgi:NAD(P)H dehydrogenase (quinone)
LFIFKLFLKDFDEALKDVQIVFCTVYRVEGWQHMFPKFVRKCSYKNIEHFVNLSFLHPILRDPKGTSLEHQFCEMALKYREKVPYCSFHGNLDDYVITTANNDSCMVYTILASAHLMTNALFLQGKILRADHKYVSASYGMGINYVSPNDVADAAVVVILKRKEHANRIYNLTGPGPTKDSEVVQLLSELIYKEPIEHVQLGYHEYMDHMRRVRKLPAWQVKDAAEFEKMKAMGYDEAPTSYTKDLETLTGKRPETFSDFLRNQKSCMRPGKSFP